MLPSRPRLLARMASTSCSVLESNLKRENLERLERSTLDNFKLSLMRSPRDNGEISSSLTSQYGLLELVRLLLQNKLKILTLKSENG